MSVDEQISIKRLFKELRLDITAVFGFIVVFISIVIALAAPMIAPYNPYALLWGPRLPPSWTNIFGTDELGRDLLSRMIYGTRDVLYLGIIGSLMATLIGVLIGAISAYFGKYVDYILMRLTDVLMVIPYFFLYLLVISTFRERSIWLMTIMLAMTGWTAQARIVRSEFLGLKEREFVKAAKSLGASDFRIIVFHILPNCMGSIIVTSTIRTSTFILTAAGLDFLGFGDPTSLSWGTLLTGGRVWMRIAPWLTTFPGLAIFILALSFNLFGDGLRDILDPRLRGVRGRKKKE